MEVYDWSEVVTRFLDPLTVVLWLQAVISKCLVGPRDAEEGKKAGTHIDRSYLSVLAAASPVTNFRQAS
jgi:hypothetical protein